MTPAPSLLPALVIVPLVLAALSLMAARLARWLMLPAALTVLASALLLAGEVLRTGPLRYALGGWPSGLGIQMHVDGLSALMLLMTATVGVVVALYAHYFFAARAEPQVRDRFWPLWWMLWAALNALYLAADVFNTYVTLELLGLAAAGLVTISGTAVAIAAGLRYLLVALLGSLCYLLGVALLYGAYGILSIAELAALLHEGAHTTIALALMTLGLLIKSALFPLHFWLPAAHGSALAPVSAVLSALVLKASFYLLLRLWLDMFGPAVPVAAAHVLGGLGAAGILWGALAAVRQRKLKMLVAYSTVAQLGYLFLVFPLAMDAQSPLAAAQAFHGGIYYALSHAFAKAAMFLAAGTIVHAWGEDDIDHLEGTSALLPWSLFAFAVAGMTLMGLPPSGGFIGKWLLLQSAFASSQWWWIVVLLISGLLTAIYVFRVLRSAFVPPLPDRQLRAVPRGMQLTALALAIISLLLGLTAGLPIGLLEADSPAHQVAG